MSRLTLDSNVYVSALNFGGQPMRLLEMMIDGQVQVAVSEPMVNEVMRVLREKFQWDEEELRDAEKLITEFAECVYPVQAISAITSDPDDNRVLECATEAGSEYIITGDNDLLRLGSYGPARIVRVAEFIQIVAGKRT